MKIIAYISIFFLVAACNDEKETYVKIPENPLLEFTIPANFPEPSYNITLNPPTEKGFELGKKLFYDGKLSSDLNIVSVNEVYEEVLTAMKSGDPSNVRKVLRSNPIDYTKLYTFLYDKMMTCEDSIFKNDFIAITEVAEGAYRDDIVAIKEINFIGVVLKMIRQGAI